MKSRYRKVFCLVCLIVLLCSCAHRSGHLKRNNMPESGSTQSEVQTRRQDNKIQSSTTVKMRNENGIYKVPIEVNGLPLEFIFDTGASNISISVAEATVMSKQGKITQDDIIGQVQMLDATGGMTVGTQIRLKTIKIGDITMNNVEATVADNMEAPLLLGQTALSRFGKISIDYKNLIISFN